MTPTPILFLGDAPERPGGLSRILRDLATLTSRLPQFRVGTLGRGARGSRQLPFVQYGYDELTGQWGELYLEQVWRDFAGDERGVVFTIWDASRLHWFAQPSYLPSGGLRDFLMAGHFDRWGYFPIDSTGPLDRLTTQSRDTLLGYNRVLAYTCWARDLVTRSIGNSCDLDWLPHGLNLDTFKPQDRRAARAWSSRLHANDTVVGVVAANQTRKDWGLVAMVARLLRDRFGSRFRIWWHSDALQRAWNLPALVADYGLSETVVLTIHAMTDAQLATAYASCDLTLHPGLGEGFCYPLAESLACGTPAIAGDYAGGAELLKDRAEWLLAPAEMRLDTLHNCFRPVFNPVEWTQRAAMVIESAPEPEACRAMVEHLAWTRLWHQWKKWLLRGAV